MYRTIREQGDHLVQLALERDQTVLGMATVRVENGDLHGQLAKYGQVIKAYGTQHTPPSRNTITQKEINTQKTEERKKEPHRQARPTRRPQRRIDQPESRPDHTSHSRQVWFV